MSFLKELAKKRAANRQMSAKEHDEYLLSLSNDETSADELRIVFRFFILPIFFIWVAYVGYIHLSKELISVVPEQHIFWLAAGLPLLFQFIKAYCATKCLRAFHFKWYDKSAHDFWLYLMLGVLTLFAFVWTLKISFWDVKNTIQDNYVERNTITLQDHLKVATADIDAQIIAQKQKEADLGSVVKKNGKVNWAKQPIAAENAKSSSALDAQRAEIVSAATKEFEKRAGTIETQSKTRGNFFQRFGGFGEVGEIICFIIIGLLEAKLRNLNGQPQQITTAPPPFQHNGKQHERVKNNAQRYYFNRLSPTGDVIIAYEHSLHEQQPLFEEEKSVSQPPLTVTQPNSDDGSNYADDVFRLAMKQIQGHAANFDRKHGKNETTAQNIHDILDQTLFKMKGTFRPSNGVHAVFSNYVTATLFPLLQERGFRYPRQVQFEGWLRQVAPMQAV